MKRARKPWMIFLLLLATIVVLSCERIMPSGPQENEVLDGPAEGLTYAERRQFLLGDGEFSREFTAESGLGPLFVATSCERCHSGDGKGHPFTTLTRFGQVDSTGNAFLHLGGPQLQNRAIPGYLPETLPAGATSTQLTPPAVTGLGYLDLVSDSDILAMADPNDLDNDDISGIPNWIELPEYVLQRANSIPVNGKYIGRFGKKASAYDLLHQTVMAYNQDMGVTSLFEPVDPYSGLAEDPEVSTQTINRVVFYLKTLKTPARRNESEPEVLMGEQLFAQLKCATCHRPTLKTGVSPISALSEVEFHPYTDLLLHDMGSGLDDGYTEGSATTAEWRTPPLWGLGLSAEAQGGSYFLMHDGRARSIEEAILMHGGEASDSKTQYEALSDSQRKALLAFLQSL